MAFCPNCGAMLSGNTSFCATCNPSAAGAPVDGSQPGGMSSNVAGALAYLFGIIGGFFFLSKYPYNRDSFVRFHAYQSIYLTVFFVVLFLALATFPAGSMFLWGVMTLVRFLVILAFFILYLFLMYKALKGERVSLPVIGALAANQAD
jgi:uncharacterized membrane protein